MGKSGKRNKQKMDPKKFDVPQDSPKKDKDWSFDEIARSKTRRR